MKEGHNWFGLAGLLAIILIPLYLLRDTIRDILS